MSVSTIQPAGLAERVATEPLAEGVFIFGLLGGGDIEIGVDGAAVPLHPLSSPLSG
jgi:hypothetical protein